MRARRALLIFLLLLGGCGDDAPSMSGWQEGGPVDKTTVSVTAWRGAVRLRNSTNGRIEFSVRGLPPLAPGELPWLTTRDEGRRVALVVPENAKDVDLTIEVAAPPGIAVSCQCAAADVNVSGSWRQLDVKTAGAISAEVDRADSGELESRTGDAFYAAKAGPSGHFAAKSVSGDVSIRLPASWNGQIRCLTRGGKLDVPTHKNLRTLWDQDEKRVEGQVGTPPPKGERPAAVWGESATGNVSLRLE